MFRISRSEDESSTTLVIDGQLGADSVVTVEFCCGQEISQGKPVQLVLRDLTNIDEAGKALIRRLADKGVKLIATGVYTSYVVDRIINSPQPAFGAANHRQILGQRTS